jgi:hypothetical protein
MLKRGKQNRAATISESSLTMDFGSSPALTTWQIILAARARPSFAKAIRTELHCA